MLSNLYLSFHRQQQTGGCHHIWQRAEQAWVRTMASTGGTDTRERSRLEEGKRLLLETYPKEDDLGPPPPPPPPRPTTPRLPRPLLNGVLANLQEVLLGTKLFLLFPTIPLAIAASYFHFPSTWVFALSLLGLTPLAERVSFLTEQIAHYTGSTVGGLLNATCGNATELIIALFALRHGKIEVIKCSLVGSVLSSLLLVMGASLFFGGLANLAKSPPQKEQHYDRKQASACLSVLLLGVLCHMLPLMFRTAAAAGFGEQAKLPTLQLSRACSIFMLLAYVAYLVFQLKTHSQLFESQQEEGSGRDDVASDDQPEVGFYSALTWLAGMTTVVALLSEYVVATIEDASASWGMSVSFISIILLPLVGNAAEIAGAIIFALKNKLDISMGVSLGSAAQISMFVVPLSVTVGWMMGVHMDLDFKLLETGSLLASVLITTFTLQDGTSHYLKGLILLLCYSAIGACFFYLRAPKAYSGLQSTGTGAVVI